MNAQFSYHYEAASAGMEATRVNPYVITAMEEVGIDMSHARSKTVSEFRNKEFDYVVTVCDYAKEICPFYPGEVVLHQQFPDPSQFTGNDHEILEKVREVRDQIQRWLLQTFKNRKR
jgi:arsenate reductase